MKLIKLSLIPFICFSSFALADTTSTCTYGSETRVITLAYETQGQALPCEVQYKKKDSDKVLWRSKNLEGFCETKATEFVQKQIGWGFSCDVTEFGASEEMEAKEQ